MAKQKIDLAIGARNVAWQCALVAETGLTNEGLDKKYAKYLTGGTKRGDGETLGTFRAIREHACDPKKTYKTKNSGFQERMSVFDAVARDPDLAYVNTEVFDPSLWRLLSRPEISDSELQVIIAKELSLVGLYRPMNGDRQLGKWFLKDKSPFDFAGPDALEKSYRRFSSMESVRGLTLLAASARESLRVGEFRHISFLKDHFEKCLTAVTYNYGFPKELQILIRWLAGFRIFANRWDPDIPNDVSRANALASINARRAENGQKPLSSKKYHFWVEAEAIRLHRTQALHKYAPTPLTPEITWLTEHREPLSNALKDWDRYRETKDLWSPLWT